MWVVKSMEAGKPDIKVRFGSPHYPPSSFSADRHRLFPRDQCSHLDLLMLLEKSGWSTVAVCVFCRRQLRATEYGVVSGNTSDSREVLRQVSRFGRHQYCD